MALISLGQIDKKLLYLLCLIIYNLIFSLCTFLPPSEYANDTLCSFEEDLGIIISGFTIDFIIGQKSKRIVEAKKSFKYLIFLFLSRIIKIGYRTIYYYLIEDDLYDYDKILNTVNGIEILLMSLGTFVLLNYKYYIHHFISMIIYFIFGIISDIILGNLTSVNYKYIFFYIIYISNEVFIFCYLKYMMDKLYYQYTEILKYWGIIGIILKVFIYSSFMINEEKKILITFLII